MSGRIPRFVDLYPLHLPELCNCIADGLRALEQLFTLYPRDTEQDILDVNSEKHDPALAAIDRADRIRKLLFNEARKKDETRAAHERRVRRCKGLQSLFEKIDLQEIKSAEVRNRHAHIDEYLDTFWKGDEDKWVAYRCAAKNKQSLMNLLRGQEFFAISVYLYAVRTYIHFGKHFNLGKIYEELTAMHRALEEKGQFSPVGALIPPETLPLIKAGHINSRS